MTIYDILIKCIGHKMHTIDEIKTRWREQALTGFELRSFQVKFKFWNTFKSILVTKELKILRIENNDIQCINILKIINHAHEIFPLFLDIIPWGCIKV